MFWEDHKHSKQSSTFLSLSIVKKNTSYDYGLLRIYELQFLLHDQNSIKNIHLNRGMNAVLALRRTIILFLNIDDKCQRNAVENLFCPLKNRVSVLRERPLMTANNFLRFLTYLPTIFNPKTSDFFESFWTPLPTLKLDSINGRAHRDIKVF